MMTPKQYHEEHQAPVPDGPPRVPSTSRSRPKPYKIRTRWTLFDKHAPWVTYKRYFTKAARDRALALLQRKESYRRTIEYK